MQQFLESYGYLAVLIGTFFEGEIMLVMGSYLAHLGFLDLSLVIMCAFSGTYAGDQACYYFGAYKGIDWLAKRPKWQQKSKRLLTLMHQYRVLLILGFRYIYGLRSLAPFIFALSGIKPLQFLCLNGIGALIWATSVGGIGYLLGDTIDSTLSFLQQMSKGMMLFWIMLATLIGLVLLLRHWRQTRES